VVTVVVVIVVVVVVVVVSDDPHDVEGCLEDVRTLTAQKTYSSTNSSRRSSIYTYIQGRGKEEEEEEEEGEEEEKGNKVSSHVIRLFFHSRVSLSLE